MKPRFLIFFLLLGLLFTTNSTARQLLVPSGYPTIQGAIDSSAVGDTVLVAPGVYNEGIDFKGKNITVSSFYLTTQDTSYVSSTIIDDIDYSKARFPVRISNGENSTTLFSGFTILNHGFGGLYCKNSSPRIRRICVRGIDTILENRQYGVVMNGSNSSLDEIIIDGNVGGGLKAENCELNISNSTISDNYGGSSDQGIGAYFSSERMKNIKLTNVVIKNNRTGLKLNHQQVTIINCLIANNYAHGIWVENAIRLTMINSILSKNTDGIDFYTDGNTINIKNSIFVDNSNDGIYLTGNQYLTDVNVNNCIFWNNQSNVSRSIVGFGALSKINANGDSCDANNNLFIDPGFVNKIQDDFHLLDNSPSIGAGIWDDLSPTDIEGKERNNPPEIGIYENPLILSYRGSYSVDGKIILKNQEHSDGAHIILENQFTHLIAADIQSNEDGFFHTTIDAGVYIIHFSKENYYEKNLQNIYINSPTTLPDITMYSRLIFHTLNVPNDYQSIQEAINLSDPGDTVLVAPGRYFENLNFNGKRNIILGSYFITNGDTSFISQTVIDGNKNGRVVLFPGGEDSTAVLTGLTIANGLLETENGSGTDLHGAGILCQNSSPRLDHLVIRDNHIYNWMGDAGGQGGGLYCENSSPIVEYTVIRNNSALSGTGVYCNNHSSPRMNDIVMNSNSGGQTMMYKGGNVMSCADNSNPVITHMRIFNNYSSGFSCSNSSPIIRDLQISGGGYAGFSCSGSSNPFIVDLSIRHIFTWDGDYGMGILCSSGSSPVFQNVKLSGAPFNGIQIESGSKPTFINTVIDSIGYDSPKSIYCNNSSPIFINTTISHPVTGGQYWQSHGIYSKSGANPRFINCIITDQAYGITCNGGTVSISNSDIWNSTLANFNGVAAPIGIPVMLNAHGDSCDAFFNISKDPQFTGGYQLSSNSPCIGAGTSLDATEFDIIGVRRHNPPDMGAYEFDRPLGVTENIPVRFALHHNFPNPFNPSTTISYSLPSSGNGSLCVYDATGQKIRTLVSGCFEAGNHAVVWDGRDSEGRRASSGVYFAVLKANGHSAVRRMLLLK